MCRPGHNPREGLQARAVCLGRCSLPLEAATGRRSLLDPFCPSCTSRGHDATCSKSLLLAPRRPLELVQVSGQQPRLPSSSQHKLHEVLQEINPGEQLP